jgi:SAM-dependent methyltransferase
MKNDQIIKCILCGNSAELRHKEYPGYQEPDTFMIYHCLKCDTAFSLPRVESSAIYEAIYKNGEKVPGYDRYWEYAKVIKYFANPLEYLAETEVTYWGIKEALSFYVKDKKSTNILEIGSGLGYLTYALIKAGYVVVGLDISQTAVEHAKRIFGDYYICANLFEYAQLHPGSFDTIILTEVIEHIDNPIDFIKSIIKLLKPGGQAIITAPNKSFYPADTVWVTDLPPVHCWLFSEESMRYVAKRINVNVSFVDFSDYYKGSFYSVNTKSLVDNQLPTSVLNKNGELIIQATRANMFLVSYLRLLATRIPYLKFIYRKLKKILNTNGIVYKDKGCVLCAILRRS